MNSVTRPRTRSKPTPTAEHRTTPPESVPSAPRSTPPLPKVAPGDSGYRPHEDEQVTALRQKAFLLISNSAMNRDAAALVKMAKKLEEAIEAFTDEYDAETFWALLVLNNGFTAEQWETLGWGTTNAAENMLEEIVGIKWALGMFISTLSSEVTALPAQRRRWRAESLAELKSR